MSYSGNRRRGSNFKTSRFRRGRSNKTNKKKEKVLDSNLFISKDIQLVSKQEDYIGRDFSEYNLNQIVQNNLLKKGFNLTTKVQEEVLEKLLENKDVFVTARTGSGKTGAFLIPTISKILNDSSQNLLIIAPTRELAKQIHEESISLVRGSSIRSELIVGGESMYRQIRNLSRKPNIIIGTPGRLKDLYDRNELKFNAINNIVLDEVDRMLDMGFVNEIQDIFTKISENRQSLFFSATTDKRVEKIVQDFTKSVEYIHLTTNKPSKSVYQDIIKYSQNDEKIDLLSGRLKQNEFKKVLVFVETKRYADKVSKKLYRLGHKAEAIHGDKRQNQRVKILNSFKNSKIDVLIATNVAARGIDIEDITHVVNLDTPTNYEEYIHRIGRVGRNGKVGYAYTFVQG